MDEDIVFTTVTPDGDPSSRTLQRAMQQIRALLASRDLELDGSIQRFVVARKSSQTDEDPLGRIVACCGIAHGVLRDTAIAEEMEGTNLLTALFQEVSYAALDLGYAHLFLFTKPRYKALFEACGFHTIAQVAQAVLLENTPFGIHSYTERLSEHRRYRDKIGSIVVNANPFTKGHQHLVRTAVNDCDHLHLFVVREDVSFFRYEDRLALVRAGVMELTERDRITVHPGSQYMVSRATFPTYFLKDEGRVAAAATGIDLVLFREHIAPALGITHRYVGTEPFCKVTRQYNEDMHYWLELAKLDAPPISVVEVPRVTFDGTAISATEVRRRLTSGQLDTLEGLVPEPTMQFLRDRYGQGRSDADPRAFAHVPTPRQRTR